MGQSRKINFYALDEFGRLFYPRSINSQYEVALSNPEVAHVNLLSGDQSIEIHAKKNG